MADRGGGAMVGDGSHLLSGFTMSNSPPAEPPADGPIIAHLKQ
jgi:hypothetical protein